MYLNYQLGTRAKITTKYQIKKMKEKTGSKRKRTFIR
ncbi:Putative protein [Zobellia galactanivorans]|uniref:Uncharacterized protein n=1 Tax=Zobellia galactanivorans (strain DSM 12802 / CCUG 47099 / CIP 106680 / NCIMB 13871 / Dsij) TaxID=63186 RepID=G0L0D6_ZOBGA|nr:Putative protein [Zobellia galactanivorans]